MKLTHGDLHLLLNRARSAPNAKAVAQAVLLASVVLGWSTRDAAAPTLSANAPFNSP